MPEFSSIEFQTGGPGTVFGLRVNPGADDNCVDGPYGDRLKLSIREPATDGKANTELTSFLATLFRCSSRHIEIISGQSSRDKRVRVHGRTPKEIRALLNKQVQT